MYIYTSMMYPLYGMISIAMARGKFYHWPRCHVATLTRSPGLMAPLLQQQTCEEVRLGEEAIRTIPENGLER